ncbi:MAG: aldo/keto reductase [Mogibacterium sp.]|nr:aldo/keto reductase [Mogibacterium sp.]
MGREFGEIKGHLGFGMMRLPMNGDEIDHEAVSAMVDRFIECGFNYFDTAHGYHDGKSEIAVRKCLTSRHDRSEYLLTDKLTDEFFKSEEDIRPLIQLQLDTCGVEYFDFLLMHAQNKENFEYFKKCRAYETAFDLKKEGKVRHVGLSFHDHASVLDQILTEYPEIEVVQIQFNYLDYESLEVESRKVYEVCRRHNKPVLVMEPVRGGNLVNLPEEAQAVFDGLRAETGSDCSNAGYALRFAAGFEGMEVILSGMSNMQQMEENLRIFSEGGEEGFIPFSDKEFEAVRKVAGIFNDMGVIPCTQCRYCIEENHCPMEIRIPSLFSSYNRNLMFHEVLPWMTYEILTSEGHGKASDCIQCGMCESVCPQHLDIRDLLVRVAEQFE